MKAIDCQFCTEVHLQVMLDLGGYAMLCYAFRAGLCLKLASPACCCKFDRFVSLAESNLT